MVFGKLMNAETGAIVMRDWGYRAGNKRSVSQGLCTPQRHCMAGAWEIARVVQGKYAKNSGDVQCAMRFKIDIQICNTCCCRQGMLKRTVQSTVMSETCRRGNCAKGHLKWEALLH